MSEATKVLVTGGAGFMGSKKVYLEVLNCICCGKLTEGLR
jgi:dTDP-D-glucose 4,6-dehydratase